MAKKNPEDDDPVLAVELDRALSPYRSLVPPDMLEVYRSILRDSLTKHAVGKALLDRVKAIDRRAPKKSGEETKEGATGERAAGATVAPSTPKGRR